jgi:UDP-N-acetylglucosamine--N-acetylmuramyl-(pentapeptide) pyrophosphoryl-undecaprenol N-acetylglucosamine transferase
MSALHVVIMAGGTGGHVFPALAVARELTGRGASVSWLGTRRGLESRLVPEAGFPIDYISIAGLRGNGVVGWLLAPLRLLIALVQALQVMLRRRPGVVLGMGGFVTGPGGVATRLLGKPLVIHEQNAIAGLTNRLLARIATRILEAFPATFQRSGVQQTGNPVRREIVAVPQPAQRYASHSGPVRLLVVGGSLGARALNEALPQALALIPEARRPEVLHQSGAQNIEQARHSYQEAGVAVELHPFIDDMATAYSWADLVICRAGALTVSELAAAGVPALLIPFPYAVDDHQTANARFLVDAGAARLLPQSEMDPQKLSAMLKEFCLNPETGRERLQRMAEAARQLARPDAAQQVVDICQQVAGMEVVK